MWYGWRGTLFPAPKDPKVIRKAKTAPWSQGEGRTTLLLSVLPGHPHCGAPPSPAKAARGSEPCPRKTLPRGWWSIWKHRVCGEKMMASFG